MNCSMKSRWLNCWQPLAINSQNIREECWALSTSRNNYYSYWVTTFLYNHSIAKTHWMSSFNRHSNQLVTSTCLSYNKCLSSLLSSILSTNSLSTINNINNNCSLLKCNSWFKNRNKSTTRYSIELIQVSSWWSGWKSIVKNTQ